MSVPQKRPRKEPDHWKPKRPRDKALRRDLILFLTVLAIAIVAVGVVLVMG
jgi:uncharacterized iron-regulated membrane protein